MKPIDQLSDDEFARLVQRAAALPDAPPALLRAAIGQWQSAQPSLLETAARAILRRVAAALTFDSWAAGSLAIARTSKSRMAAGVCIAAPSCARRGAGCSISGVESSGRQESDSRKPERSRGRALRNAMRPAIRSISPMRRRT